MSSSKIYEEDGPTSRYSQWAQAPVADLKRSATMELLISFIYFVALLGSSYYFHRKHPCLRASLLSGIVTSASAGALVAFSEINEKFSVASFAGVIALAVIFGSLFSALLSALVGAACQIQKK
jgi:hypothetical protein